MKPSLLVGLALVLLGSLRGQPLKPETLLGSNHMVSDPEYGITFTCPDGWQIRNAFRWGDLEATINLGTPSEPGASPNVYYRALPVPLAPAEGFEAWLRNEARLKEKDRAQSNAYAGYANRADSFAVSTIGGCPALSWRADFTRNGQKWTECMTNIASPHARAFFFMTAPAEKLEAMRPAFDAMAASTRLTTGSLVQNIDPRIVEARRFYLAKEYQKAVDVFIEAFKGVAPKPNDLVVAAGAAVRVGNNALALPWLSQAVAAGGNSNLRLTGNADFNALHDTDEWKKLIANLPGAQIQPAVETITDRPLQQTLLTILDDDQKYRRQIADTEKKFGRNSDEFRTLVKAMSEADAADLAKVTTILDERGWVGPDVVGRRASDALFLVIQHADHATQEKYLPMMREAVKAKKARGDSLALLEDRVALGEGRPQIYGSQIGRDPASGKYFVSALTDPDRVDERRASVGLQPLADYVKHWEIAWDVEAYKKQLPELEAKLQKR